MITYTLMGLCFLVCSALSSCDQGWFGQQCQLMCHCAKLGCASDGTCLKHGRRCAEGYFGQACQIRSQSFNGPRNISSLSKHLAPCIQVMDNDPVDIIFNNSITVTWLRLGLVDHADRPIISLHVYDVNNQSEECSLFKLLPSYFPAVDITCYSKQLVRRLVLIFDIPTLICSIHVSGGRDFALKQFTNQSTNGLLKWNIQPGRGVNGQGAWDCDMLERNDSAPVWSVYLGNTRYIQELVVYASNGYILEGFGDGYNASVFYVKQAPTIQLRYGIKYWPEQEKNMEYFHLKFLPSKEDVDFCVCDFRAYGECAPPNYGLLCDQICDINCIEGRCHYDGRCYGCIDGHTGTYCDTDLTDATATTTRVNDSNINLVQTSHDTATYYVILAVFMPVFLFQFLVCLCIVFLAHNIIRTLKAKDTKKAVAMDVTADQESSEHYISPS